MKNFNNFLRCITIIFIMGISFINFEIIFPKKAMAVIDEENGGGCSHSYSWKTTKAATCTTQGTMVYKCSKCSNISNTKQTSALGHNYKPATCTEAQMCTRCNVKVGGPLGHSYNPATCTTPKTCSRCGATSGSALGHNYKPATCTEAQMCTRCNVKVGGPLGHSYNPATCTTPKTCSRCGATSGNALGHKYTYTKKDTIYHIVKCTNCSYSITSKHIFSGNECNMCDYVKPDEMPIDIQKCNHRLSWVTTKVATCTNQGVMVYKCAECGEVLETKTIEKLEHNYNIKIGKYFYNSKQHFEKYKCSCGDTITKNYQDHKLSADGNCVFGCGYSEEVEKCSLNNFLTGHDQTVKIKYKENSNGHIKMTICTTCNITVKEEQQNHNFDTKVESQYDDKQHWEVWKCICGKVEKKMRKNINSMPIMNVYVVIHLYANITKR